MRSFAFLFLLMVAMAPGYAVTVAAGEEMAWRERWSDVTILLKVLESTPAGKDIVAAARARDKNFAAQIRGGAGSFTESTLTRSYSLADGKEQVEFTQVVTINQSLPLSEAVVDLAHELAHYAFKQPVDPYRISFNPKDFITNGIEGVGGELEAFAVECKVAWELQRAHKKFPRHKLCTPYVSGADGEFAIESARRDYYALGSWHKVFPKDLGFPVSDRRVVFSSSYAQKPYPVALLAEFQATQKSACLNNQRKFQLITAQAKGGGEVAAREPASDLSVTRHAAVANALREYQLKNCSKFAEPSGNLRK